MSNHNGWVDVVTEKGEIYYSLRYQSCCQTVRTYFKLNLNHKCGKTAVGINAYIPKERLLKHHDSEVFIKDWVKFLNLANMPCEYKGIVSMDTTNGVRHSAYSGDRNEVSSDLKNRESYLIYIDYNKCKTNHHALMVYSCIRYLWANQFSGIVDEAIKISNEFKHWQELICLQLAHYIFPSYYTQYYGLMPDKQASKPLTNKQFLYRLDKQGKNEAFTNINSLFTNVPKVITFTYDKIVEMARKGQYQEILDLFEKTQPTMVRAIKTTLATSYGMTYDVVEFLPDTNQFKIINDNNTISILKTDRFLAWG